MSESAKTSNWTDPDDAPELGPEFFQSAKPMVAGKPVSPAEFEAVKKRMGRPPVPLKRPTLNMRVDADVLEALKASGKGWQTRVNTILRQAVLERR